MEELKVIVDSCNKEMDKILNNLKQDIFHIRLGSRSIIVLLEKMKVKCYNTLLSLSEIANITIIDNMNITIQPWDLSIIGNIDKTIIDANLGFTPVNKGKLIHINLPIITEESRKNLLKKIKNYTEKSKILIRKIRKINNQRIKNIKISEDLSKIGENEIQKITTLYINKIEDIFISKKKEILTI
ncbi:ribosome-recycling factor [Blattabacterium cuenoti]|uniref:ribosome-recycling factor n=1 Tax=Blattabacterium cuenoti TaxID=1653831 RepID=UPI00163C6902|nr:ribosome-recycling factor [Blattabacterium cuenoti]